MASNPILIKLISTNIGSMVVSRSAHPPPPPPPLNHHHGPSLFFGGLGHFPHSFCLKKVRDIDPYGIRVLSVPEKQAADSWFLGYEW